jgi:hypothetical protein
MIAHYRERDRQREERDLQEGQKPIAREVAERNRRQWVAVLNWCGWKPLPAANGGPWCGWGRGRRCLAASGSPWGY